MQSRWVGSLLFLGGLAHADEIPAVADPTMITIRATHDGSLERGRVATVSLIVTPGAGLTLLEEGPLVLEVIGAATDPAKRTLHRADAVDPRASLPRFELSVKPHKEGTPRLDVELTAWLCQARRCRPVVQRTTLPLAVRP